MGNSSSKPKEPLPELKLPIGVREEYTRHKEAMHLLLTIEPSGFLSRSTYQTNVQDAGTKQEVFSIGASMDGIQTLYSSTRVPLLVLLKKPGIFNVDEYTCQNAETRQEVFQAMSTSTFGLTWTVRFANLAGNGESIQVKFNVDSWRQEAIITAWNVQIGKVLWDWGGFSNPPQYKLAINPGVDVSLLVISTIALHRILVQRENQRRRRRQRQNGMR